MWPSCASTCRQTSLTLGYGNRSVLPTSKKTARSMLALVHPHGVAATVHGRDGLHVARPPDGDDRHNVPVLGHLEQLGNLVLDPVGESDVACPQTLVDCRKQQILKRGTH